MGGIATTPQLPTLRLPHDSSLPGLVRAVCPAVRVARIIAVVISVSAIVGGTLAKNRNVAFLVALAFAVAASANLPTILYSLFWRRFNTAGAPWIIYGGLTVTIVLMVFSPAVLGAPAAMIKSVDSHWFPFANPGLVSIPVSFALGWLATTLSSERDDAKYAELRVRSLTGTGAEKAVRY
ncbi:hypothetical protein GFY24_19740 [Nocardia sp. SYP-A9097]|nr:hypothetical protein [Nocardia sp. SYP-A9097]